MSEEEAARNERDPSRGQVEQPVLRVVNPDATPEEVAAIVAVLSALGGGEPAPPPPRSEWANPARGMRSAPASSWRSSGLPR